MRFAFELRHASWYTPETYRPLAEHSAALVMHDFMKKAPPLVETAPFCYLRPHGPSGRYRGAYDVETLLTWAEQVRAWMRRRV